MLLGAACVGAIVAAVLLVGPPTQASQVSQRVITAEKGVVQSTVSGSGSLAAAKQVDVNFKTGGTLTNIYVSAGQHVYTGELLAAIDSQNAQVAVEQDLANLDSANARLAAVEANPSSSSSAASGSAGASTASAAIATAAAAPPAHSPAGPTGPSGAAGPQTTTVTTTTTVTRTATAGRSAPSHSTAGTAGSGSGSSSAGSTSSTTSAATQAANIASAQASVDSAQLTLKTAQATLADTKLHAPTDGTVASVASVSPGDTVTAGGGAASGSGASGAGGSGSGAGGTGSGGGAGGAGSSASSGSGTSSSSAFIVIVDLSGMDLVVPFSESDITKVKVGQPATVTVDALPDSKLAAHVTSVDTLSTSNSGVVSYDVTLRLDQLESRLRPGMSASAQVVIAQGSGTVTVPTSAISRGGGQATVTVLRNGKDVTQPVLTGIAGDSDTQIVSGLSAGQQIVIRTATSLGTGAASATGAAGRFGGLGAGALGGGGLGGGGGGLSGGGGGGGGGGAFFRGGG